MHSLMDIAAVTSVYDILVSDSNPRCEGPILAIFTVKQKQAKRNFSNRWTASREKFIEKTSQLCEALFRFTGEAHSFEVRISFFKLRLVDEAGQPDDLSSPRFICCSTFKVSIDKSRRIASLVEDPKNRTLKPRIREIEPGARVREFRHNPSDWIPNGEIFEIELDMLPAHVSAVVKEALSSD